MYPETLTTYESNKRTFSLYTFQIPITSYTHPVKTRIISQLMCHTHTHTLQAYILECSSRLPKPPLLPYTNTHIQTPLNSNLQFPITKITLPLIPPLTFYSPLKKKKKELTFSAIDPFVRSFLSIV